MKNKDKTRGILYIIIAVLFLILGIILIPEVTSLGELILNYLLAIFIIMYVILYLGKKIRKTTSVKQILIIIEIVLDIVLAASLIVSKIVSFISIKECLGIIGAVLWLHGMFSAMRGYLTASADKKKYPLYMLIIDLFIITLATYLFVAVPIKNQVLIYLCSISCFIATIVSLVIGIIYLNGKQKQIVNKN